MKSKLNRVLLVTFLLIFSLNSFAYAAKSSSKPPSRPSAPTQSAPATTNTAPASGYKPSAPASSYNDKAPAAKQAAAAQTTQPSTGSNWMRNIGMFAGGMMLGGLLSNMLGFGHSGMLADIMGMIVSIVPIIAVFLLGRFLWSRYKNRQEKKPVRY